MHVTAWPESLEVEPSERASFDVTITNTSTVIDAYIVQAFGVDPAWVSTTPDRLSLFPGEVGSVTVDIELPVDQPASQRRLALNVRSEDDPDQFALAHVELTVSPVTTTNVEIDPPMIQAGSQARFGIIVHNVGNAPVTVRPIATDPEDLATFTFDAEQLTIPAGSNAVAKVEVKGGRAWFGQPRPRIFTLGVIREDDVAVEGQAVFIQRPRIGRWVLMLLGLLLAAAVFAAVLSRTFAGVVEEASVDNALLESALQDGGAEVNGIPINPGGVTGKVVSLSTESGVAGVQAELYLAEDTNVVIASAATDDEGIFTFGSLRGGTYKLRLTGAGFAPVWYPSASTPDNAEEIPVELGAVSPLDDLVIGGLPGSASGRVVGTDPAGAIVSLVVNGQLEPTQQSLVAQVEASADGSFLFETVPSPAVYTLTVQKAGFATEQRSVTLSPGQQLEGIEVRLRPGNGVISGFITGPDGALGGATVTATDGSSEITTVSLTVDGVKGSYKLRNLATPGRYTVTVTRDGYASESRSVSLGESEEFSLDIALARSEGTISGLVSLNDVGPSGGVSISVEGAGGTFSTTTVSQGGVVGSFLVDRVPIPGSYTVTFARTGYVSQVILVELNPLAGTSDLVGLETELARGTATVRGVVRNSEGDLVSQAFVSLSDGSEDVYEMLTADDPLGQFRFTNIPPGSYTVRASLEGTTEAVALVSLLPSSDRELTFRLGIQAGITGIVTRPNAQNEQVPAQGITVRLIPLADFPRTDARAVKTLTDSQGRYEFGQLDGGLSWIVAIYETDAPVNAAVDSLQVDSEDGRILSVRNLVYRPIN